MRNPKADEQNCYTCDHFCSFPIEDSDGSCSAHDERPTNEVDYCSDWKHFTLPDWVYDSVTDLEGGEQNEKTET